MALIKCPDCGREVSSFANSCPNCGFPIAQQKNIHTVKVKLPNLELGSVGLFSSRDANIFAKGTRLWSGKHGQTASFEISEPANITIDIGKWANPFSGVVEPGKRYACVQDLGMHWKATFRLSEVDIIDSD